MGKRGSLLSNNPRKGLKENSQVFVTSIAAVYLGHKMERMCVLSKEVVAFRFPLPNFHMASNEACLVVGCLCGTSVVEMHAPESVDRFPGDG